MLTPTPKQADIRDAEPLDLLVVAPAGCGKTEALALRVQGLLRRGVIKAPQKVLVVTFSNRARDNIKERLRFYLTPAEMRDRVTVVNFHGLSARLFRAHANVIGQDPAASLPEGDWIGDEIRRLNLGWGVKAAVEKALREAKQEALTDAEVESKLTGQALAFEQQRKADGRLTYDDLPRVAELILANEVVADLYRAHFGAVIVDEFQDLTPQQLRLVRRIGLNRTTYAGDLAQGIYGFAGARPVAIDAAIRTECSAVIELNESHRSSPAVLNAVNSLAGLTGGTLLVSADPASWPSGGLVGSVGHVIAQDEAEYVVKLSKAILNRAPSQRIGVLARAGSRRRFVDDAFAASDLEPHRWDDGVLDTDTAKIVKAMLASFDLVGYLGAPDKIAFLREASNFASVTDGRDSLASAVGWCFDLLHEGLQPSEIRSRIRVGNSSTLITVPGVHLLTGHVGKGQQFDWVIVVGMEDGSIPNFNANTAEEVAEEARVLAVMLSRARHGAILSHAQTVPTLAGVIRNQNPSRFYTQLNSVGLRNAHDIVEWLKAADWDAISQR
jgi:DNA helicase-2/ATP-dependent DNA helicase PcrA